MSDFFNDGPEEPRRPMPVHHDSRRPRPLVLAVAAVDRYTGQAPPASKFPGGKAWINYAGPTNTVPRTSYADVINGNGAVAYVMKNVCGGVIGYPITPSTEISELFEAARAEGQINVFGKHPFFVETEGERTQVVLGHGVDDDRRRARRRVDRVGDPGRPATDDRQVQDDHVRSRESTRGLLLDVPRKLGAREAEARVAG